MSAGIVLMSRAPLPGRTKTRLQSHLSGSQCAELHRAFLKDISQMLLKVQKERDIKLYLAYTPAGTEEIFKQLLPEEFECFPQQGENLGVRMEQALQYAGEENESRIIIGSDLPALEPGVLTAAVDLLAEKDIVIGPAEDGGYYLCGVNENQSFLFADQLWGQSDILDSTLQRIKNRAGLEYGLLEPCQDVDYYSELLELKRQLEQNDWQHYPAFTAEVLENILESAAVSR